MLANEQKEKAKKKIETQAASKELKGKMTLMMRHLKNNTSPAQYSMAGIDIKTGQINLLEATLTKSVEGKANTSLKCLHMCRKKITDQQGKIIAKFLENNTTL